MGKHWLSNVAGELALLAGLVLWATKFPRTRTDTSILAIPKRGVGLISERFLPCENVKLNFSKSRSVVLHSFGFLGSVDGNTLYHFVFACSVDGNFSMKQKKKCKGTTQILNMEGAPPVASPNSWLYKADRELESLPQQSLLQSINLNYRERLDIKTKLFSFSSHAGLELLA
ncbi:unnamed protein product [Fraxinus pennsylvanica]|uniref:Uncharacterized protein n=1 Tax=Fraxinus pennsylvanica TaxID=56036 RepID=A0AAD1ZGD7_9LAMI|nr:unnamed protein product [Fraxinus pennsylvanica]